ncbi:DUF4198 domain-containing protein [Blastopirellula sp. JC732]|uniref:DUF4198 domain-containing protein n=1 Tax=Blastopirellula sediminis TaxID=2894196 RepID=A0A9X1MMH8_9BACT|nr:DUF4198 domain-containing protein [Blastopirellula sediminis]MCC9606846.1 DUF4198 domain-containing protein [Blastopirellula sediminis]MCC9629858.1 DUF4198 domain-containing protein [Blastopirellula sediminis]
MLRKLTSALAVALLVSAIIAPAQAHFLWLVESDNPKVLNLYFSEGPYADEPAILKRVEDAVAYKVFSDKEPEQIKFTLADEELKSEELKGRGESLYALTRSLGVMERGGEKFLLQYNAKTGPTLGKSAWKRDASKLVTLDVVPTLQDGEAVFTVTFAGKPVEGAEVSVDGANGKEKAETDSQGIAKFAANKAGLYAVRAKYVEPKSGQVGDDKYDSIRHYTTLTLPVIPKLNETLSAYPDLPEAVTSFGAAVIGDALYAYGGHTGDAHHYYYEAQNGSLQKLSLKKDAKWETVAEGPKLQGLAMVAHGDKLYRIGGFTAMNKEEEEGRNLVSQADVAAFDLKTGKWSDLPKLPEPRSSFDAVVLGDKIYVIGGWALNGEDKDSTWHKTAYSLDLSQPSAEWTAIAEPPFQRRANSVGVANGKIYSIGGMQEEGGPTTRVAVYDPEAKTWSEGPELPGGNMDGFGTSTFAQGGKLYVSTMSGRLVRLADDGKSWETVGGLTNERFFHRMLPVGKDQLILLGGASMTVGKFSEVDVVNLK